MVDVDCTGDLLTIDDETVRLEREVADLVVVDDVVVVRLRSPPDVDEDRNVVAFDADGNRLWRIEPPTEAAGSQSYHHIGYNEGRLEAVNWDNYLYEVDLETGAVEAVRFMGK